MANERKGAFWLSEFKETKNPYFGKTNAYLWFGQGRN